MILARSSKAAIYSSFILPDNPLAASTALTTLRARRRIDVMRAIFAALARRLQLLPERRTDTSGHVGARDRPVAAFASRLFAVGVRPHPAVKKHNDGDPRCYDDRDGEDLRRGSAVQRLSNSPYNRREDTRAPERAGGRIREIDHLASPSVSGAPGYRANAGSPWRVERSNQIAGTPDRRPA